MDIKARDLAITKELEGLTSWEDRYQTIINLGKAFKALPESEKTEDLKVRGCQSQVWIKAEFKDGKVYFEADSDALIVKGLIALLVRIYSGASPQEILNHKPEFITKLGLNAHLSPSRANGLFAMLKQIQFYALAFSVNS